MHQSAASQGEMPVGAEVASGGTNFRVWAPQRELVHVVLADGSGQEQNCIALTRDEDGCFAGHARGIGHGDLYAFRLDGDGQKYPDPASRFQPLGVHGYSQVIDLRRYQWRDARWRGVTLRGQVLYELHVGLFTPEGTWRAAIDKLSHLRGVGVTLLEIMPVADFAGDFGWGYDGVYWYAPYHNYGTPDDFRALVDAAHQHGIGVILDVVYNHFGPTGNYAAEFSPYYVTSKHTTEWGEAINFDGDHCEPVRQFVAANAAYWIRDFHLDGLRLDATQAIFDDSPEHILTLITRSARQAAGERSIVTFAESEPQLIRHVAAPEEGGFGMDGLWNDDFHHAARVAATGNNEGYYGDYAGSAQELVSTTRLGYLFQGQWNPRQKRRRGTSSRDLPGPALVHYLQNHDQIANSAAGMRTQLLTTPGRHRALTALLLLGPATPLLFMGQEYGASKPFLYFADHEKHLAPLVRDGRWSFLHQFPRVTGYAATVGLNDPSACETYELSKLDWEECDCNTQVRDLHRDLLTLRKEDPVFARQDKRIIEGAITGPEAFILRWFGDSDGDRLMLVNLGRDFHLRPNTEPLTAPPIGCEWHLLWSSDESKYGGHGTAPFLPEDWHFPGHAAIVLKSHAHGGPTDQSAQEA